MHIIKKIYFYSETDGKDIEDTNIPDRIESDARELNLDILDFKMVCTDNTLIVGVAFGTYAA